MIDLLARPFYFLRHGETAANVADLVSGATDDALTARGLAQAEAAAAAFAGIPLAAIWHSPLTRARRTAEAVSRATGAPLHPLAGLAERNWGAWEGQPRAVLVREATPPGGEGPEAFRARVRAALSCITAPFPVLIVGHSGTQREIHALLSDRAFRRPGNARPMRWAPAPDGHWICTELSPNRQSRPLESRLANR